ncbi:ICAM5 protein, partial [Cephalopterus ornatus]|nr:ICAM5 protein [Cephalopterus ornatus]
PALPAVRPRLDDAGCPAEQNWTEGQEETLRCRARGNPRPQVSCARDGRSFPAGIPQPITRGHAGTYRCRASNALGEDERSVTVRVHGERGLGGPRGCCWPLGWVSGVFGLLEVL